jgi:hypothetical protein
LGPIFLGVQILSHKVFGRLLECDRLENETSLTMELLDHVNGLLGLREAEI